MICLSSRGSSLKGFFCFFFDIIGGFEGVELLLFLFLSSGALSSQLSQFISFNTKLIRSVTQRDASRTSRATEVLN